MDALTLWNTLVIGASAAAVAAIIALIFWLRSRRNQSGG